MPLDEKKLLFPPRLANRMATVNGTCRRCPAGSGKCTDKRHKCRSCNGLGITANYERCKCTKPRTIPIPGVDDLASILGHNARPRRSLRTKARITP